VPTPDAAATAAATGAGHVVDWIERELGGTVVAVDRLPRWRAGWTIDVARGDEVLHLYARGERGADFPSPFALEHEEAVHDLLESHGLPVPHVHGVIDGPVRVLLMDRVPGQQGLALADPADRERLLFECIDHMAAMHRIPMEEVARRGILVPTEPGDVVVSDVFRRVERRYLDAPVPRDPVTEFLRRWLRREAPRDRTRPAFVAWDSAQFLHDAGELTALIDFELAHVGDPYMDLAPLRTRDSMEPLGQLAPALARYAELTGAPIDLDLVRYFEISQLTVTLMLQWPVVCDPDPDSDYVTHLTWYVESGRYAIDVMGERAGWPVADIAVPEPRRTRQAAAHAHLVRSLHRAARAETRTNLVRFGIDVGAPTAGAADGATPAAAAPGGADAGHDFAGWRTRCDYRLARHLQRLDEIGDAVDAADVDDVARLLGRSVTDRAEADVALLAFVDAAGPEHDRALFDLCARRLQRWHLTLGPPGSLVVRHPPLQPLADPGQANAPAR
jgi:aminoglycoside phosphotransferase (APT) family kinase protein